MLTISKRRSLLQLVLIALGMLCLSACDTTSSIERKAEKARQAAEQARMRAAFLGRIHEAEAEVWEILHPLMQKAANYRSEETHSYIGAAFVTEDYYSEALLQEARAEGYGNFISVLDVFPGSPADEAGLQSGDRLLLVNGSKVPEGSQASIYAARKIKRLLVPEQLNTLTVLRGDEELELAVEPVLGAYYAVVVMASGEIDLHVDGDVIWIGLPLIEKLKTSEDLTFLCAYALAKSVMRHPKQKGKNALLGQLLDVAAAASGVGTGGLFGSMGGNAYSHAFEIEADLIALYLLASTGYSIDGYPNFWEDVLRSRSRKDELSAKDFERIETANKVIASIRAKREAGEPIFPEAYLQGDVSEIE